MMLADRDRYLTLLQFEQVRELCHILCELKNRRSAMLYWALVCLVIAIVAGVLGFGGIAGTAAGFAQILFFIFIVLLVVSLIANALRGKGPKI